jgi:hypothetical protein
MEQVTQASQQDPPYIADSNRAAANFSNSLTGSCRALPSSELLADTDKLKGKIVLVTGQHMGWYG